MTPNYDSTDWVDVHYDNEGRLTLTCGSEAFVRYRDAVFAGSGFGPDVPKDQVCFIVIEVYPPVKRRGRSSRDWLVGAGCSLAVACVLSVFFVGAITIGRWLIGR
jgi:hypothetical protein